jgi:hypothetical protein
MRKSVQFLTLNLLAVTVLSLPAVSPQDRLMYFIDECAKTIDTCKTILWKRSEKLQLERNGMDSSTQSEMLEGLDLDLSEVHRKDRELDEAGISLLALAEDIDTIPEEEIPFIIEELIAWKLTFICESPTA